MNIKPVDLVTLPVWIKVFKMGGVLPISELCFLTRDLMIRKKWLDEPTHRYFRGREDRILMWGPYEFSIDESINLRRYTSKGKWK